MAVMLRLDGLERTIQNGFRHQLSVLSFFRGKFADFPFPVVQRIAFVADLQQIIGISPVQHLLFELLVLLLFA